MSFKKRAPRAIKEIRAFAEKAMVRLQPYSHVAASSQCSCDAQGGVEFL